MDREDEAAFPEAEPLGEFGAVDLLDDLEFEEVIAAAERADLRHAAGERAVADDLGIGAGIAAAVLDVLEVARNAEAVVDRPLRAFGDDAPLVVRARRLDRAFGAHARRD